MAEREVKVRLATEQAGDKKAVREAAKDVEALGKASEKAKRPLDSLGESAKKTGKQVKDLEGAGEVGKAFERAGDQVRNFEKRVKDGGEGMEEFAARSRFALDRLKEEIEELRRSGRGLTDEHERELRELEDAYKRSTKEAGKFKRAQADARRDVAEAAAGAHALAQAQDPAAQKAAELSENLGRIGDVAGQIEGAASKISAALEGIPQLDVSGTLAALEQIGTGLDALIAKANQADAALQNALSAEGA